MDKATPPHKVARCREEACGAQVIWCTTAGGRKMPVNVDRVLGGNVVLVTGTDTTPEARVLTRDEAVRREASGSRAWVSHFSTCPAAAKRRKARR